jgi:16S rRNA (cytidine1402-2'-O)-methyltransferase
VGTLYIVGAPTGDPDDITLRARRILGQVALVVGHPPHVRHLLDCYGIAKPVVVLSEPGLLPGFDRALDALRTDDIAILSTGLSPGPSGPVYQLIRAAVERGFPVVPVPGPVLPITALVISGLPADSFVYLGTLPQECSVRRDLLASVAAERRTLVVLENAHRLSDTMTDLGDTLGNRPLVLVSASGHQTGKIWRGTVREAAEHLLVDPAEEPWVLIIGGAPERVTRWAEERLRSEIQARLDHDLGIKEISRQLAVESGWPRREIYDLAVKIAEFLRDG